VPADAGHAHARARADLAAAGRAGRRRPPLHSDAYEVGFGTLYTAVYRPAELAIEYRWPGSSWKHTIGSFADGQHEVVLGAP
jgi:hypothetical protein